VQLPLKEPRVRHVSGGSWAPSLKLYPLRPDSIEVMRIGRQRCFSGGLVLVSSLVMVLGSLATARAGEVCEVPHGGPVSLIILASGSKVQQYARATKGTVVRRDAKTVVFLDGRVITSDVEAAGRHLNALGWGGRQIKVMASFPAQRARPRRG